ncbi:MAG: T9SS type A sorting domain-containing protein, partial [Candidatus Cloacimonetes bacterium]|nr:T9SS type A sorting domain-containing protein [Candidatus Cloacimonadota bacterium]
TDTGYEYYVGWSDNRDWMTGSGIYAQKILADGSLQWGPAGLVIADGSGDDQLNDVVEDYFIWHGGSWPNQDIFVKRVDSDGSTAAGWPEDGLLVCGATGFQENARGLMVPEGLLVVWEDKRSGTADLYGQIITPEGQIVWAEDGIPLNAGVNDQIAARFLYDEYLYMVWEDFRSGIDEDIYMQKFDANGNELWMAGGNEIIVADSAQTAPCLTKNSENYLVCWQASQSDAGTDLYGQLLNEQGEKLWAGSGYLICSAIKNQNKPQAVPVSNNMSVVIWQDTRSSGKTDIYNIYAQKLRMDLLSADDPVIPGNPFTLFQNYPNPFNPETTIAFNLPTGFSEDLTLDIFNLKGQKIRSYPVGNETGQTVENGQQLYSIIWNGCDHNGLPAANGIYFYQLTSRYYQSPARKMIMLK